MRLNYKVEFTKRRLPAFPGASFLVVGSEQRGWMGELVASLRSEEAQKGLKITGLDLISCAENSAQDNNAGLVDNATCDSDFDYVVGSGLLSNQTSRFYRKLYDLLRPGGRVLSFESEHLSETSVERELASLRMAGFYRTFNQPCSSDLVEKPIFGFARIFGVLSRHLSGSSAGELCFWAEKPRDGKNKAVTYAHHTALADAVSVVVPCHNEEANVEPLIARLMDYFGPYIHEVVIVDDNSHDRTAEIARGLAATEPRIKVLHRRGHPGVGLALRDGYRSASGRYILSMDCDFENILPEMNGMFDAIAGGYDGAIGSRFSPGTLLVRYPLNKLIFNRGFHLLLRSIIPRALHDITNNLKLYRAEILKTCPISSQGFGANLETGLRPLV